ncbi:MAG TPA: D-2-hydroxyacid dehydrogenase family protein [Chloroflexota bacterium]|nr:D-2-hydroxyacid dehydrogenase family protein [Chloroflexota bacterium]
MAEARVAVIDDFHRAFAPTDAIRRLRQRAEVAIFDAPFPSHADMARALRGYPIVIANRERTHFTEAILGQLPDLRLISNTGSHFYHVDVDAATRRGVLLANAPGGSSPSVAELTIAYIIALVRRIPQTNAAMHRGEWPVELYGSVEGKTLGILGMGKIGTRVARAAVALDMRVVAWGPTLTDERAARSGVTRVEIDDLVQSADFVSVHLPLSDLSRSIMSRERIWRMKPSAFLVNTARAAIVDETALIDALRAGRIAGAALDVFLEEPLPRESPLRGMQNVILSPHAGWTTHESYGPWIEMTVENVIAYLDGAPIRIHNPEALAAHAGLPGGRP